MEPDLGLVHLMKLTVSTDTCIYENSSVTRHVFPTRNACGQNSNAFLSVHTQWQHYTHEVQPKWLEAPVIFFGQSGFVLVGRQNRSGYLEASYLVYSKSRRVLYAWFYRMESR